VRLAGEPRDEHPWTLERYYGHDAEAAHSHTPYLGESRARRGELTARSWFKQRGQVSWEGSPEFRKRQATRDGAHAYRSAGSVPARRSLLRSSIQRPETTISVSSLWHALCRTHRRQLGWFNKPWSGNALPSTGQLSRTSRQSIRSSWAKGVSTWAWSRGRTNKVTALYPYETTKEQPEEAGCVRSTASVCSPRSRRSCCMDASRDPLWLSEKLRWSQ